tara:strand:+ start:1660 stop:2103 length:444 start_codon:yes stop_codon:yes gene_type:complete
MITRALLIAEARSWIGTPYRHQASRKGVACDCLGLIRGLYRFAYGSEPEPMPPYSPDWAEAGRQETLLNAARRHLVELPIAAARPADVLLFRWRPNLPAKHCALLVTPRRIVHAYDAAGKVAEGNLQAQWDQRIVAVFAFPGIGEES